MGNSMVLKLKCLEFTLSTISCTPRHINCTKGMLVAILEGFYINLHFFLRSRKQLLSGTFNSNPSEIEVNE